MLWVSFDQLLRDAKQCGPWCRFCYWNSLLRLSLKLEDYCKLIPYQLRDLSVATLLSAFQGLGAFHMVVFL